MILQNLLQKIFHSPKDKYMESVSALDLIKFKVVVVEFSENVENSSGEIIARLLNGKDGLQVGYFDEPFSKSFLNLESRTLFDLIDRGQTILEKTQADVLVWGYREGNKIRLNFQTEKQYENENCTFVSLLDSLYLPAEMISPQNTIPPAISNLIYGAVVSALNTSTKEKKIQKRYLLKKIINHLSKDDSAKNLSLEYMPYIMNFLGLIYLSYCFDRGQGKDFKIVKNLFDTAIKHQDLITSPIHLGCIYYHLGQLYDCSTKYIPKQSPRIYKEAINYYRQAQKYLSKYNYPYDYGSISFKLAHLFLNYWLYKEDIQALRDAVFQMREAEKIYTYALFPDFWAEIQGKLGYMLGLLGNFTNSEEISELAVTSYKNQQKVITERRDPLTWAQIQQNIGDIYYRLGKNEEDKELLEEALEYFHDALYVYENAGKIEDIKKVNTDISKTSQSLNILG